MKPKDAKGRRERLPTLAPIGISKASAGVAQW